MFMSDSLEIDKLGISISPLLKHGWQLRPFLEPGEIVKPFVPPQNAVKQRHISEYTYGLNRFLPMYPEDIFNSDTPFIDFLSIIPGETVRCAKNVFSQAQLKALSLLGVKVEIYDEETET